MVEHITPNGEFTLKKGGTYYPKHNVVRWYDNFHKSVILFNQMSICNNFDREFGCF